MSSPIRALLFDVEGVIARPDRAAADRRLAALSPGLDSAAVHEARNRPTMYALWQRYSIGQVSRYAYWKAVVEALQLPTEAEQVVEMLDIQSATCWRTIDSDMLALIDNLATTDGLRLGILSNSSPDHEPFIARFEPAFDMAHFSHRTGRRKPDSPAYLEAVAALGVGLKATLFIDDKRRNTEAAACLGLRVFHYQHLADLTGELHALGLIGSPSDPPTSGDSACPVTPSSQTQPDFMRPGDTRSGDPRPSATRPVNG